jgi:uridine kinase
MEKRAGSIRAQGRLLERIAALRPKERRTLIVAIDGHGGSGKSTLASALASSLPGATVVHTDDFARPVSSGWDWERMRSQVLEPLSRNEPTKYQRYDWPTDALAEWHDVPVGGLVIVEGVSSMRNELGTYWDLSIWVTCSYERRLARGIARDGEAKRSQWENVWMPEEDRYVQEHHPERRADVTLDGEKPFPLK